MGIQLGQKSKLFLPCLVTGLRQKRVAAGSRNEDDFPLTFVGSCWRQQSFPEFSLAAAAGGGPGLHTHLKFDGRLHLSWCGAYACKNPRARTPWEWRAPAQSASKQPETFPLTVPGAAGHWYLWAALGPGACSSSWLAARCPASLYWHKKTLLRVFQIHPERRVSVVGRPGGRLLCSRAAERLSGGLCENNTADGRLCLLGSGRLAGDGQGGCSRSERGRALAAASVLPVLGRKRASWWQRTPRAPKHVLRRGASAGVPGRTRALRGFAGNSRRSGLGQQLLWV